MSPINFHRSKSDHHTGIVRDGVGAQGKTPMSRQHRGHGCCSNFGQILTPSGTTRRFCFFSCLKFLPLSFLINNGLWGKKIPFSYGFISTAKMSPFLRLAFSHPACPLQAAIYLL
jgi:hypothetical protein